MSCRFLCVWLMRKREHYYREFWQKKLGKKRRKRPVSMIEFKNVSKTYNNGTKAIQNVNLHVDKGEFV